MNPMRRAAWRSIPVWVVAVASMAAHGATERTVMPSSLDAALAEMERSLAVGSVDASYYQSVREFIEVVQRSPLPADERCERILGVVKAALAATPGPRLPPPLAVRERRNVALSLFNAPLTDVTDAKASRDLRKRYGATAVDFVRSLRVDVVADYRQRLVVLNRGLDFSETATQREAGLKEHAAATKANDDMNRYQSALGSELAFMEPRVSVFLDRLFAADPSGHVTLTELKQRLRGSAR